MQVFVTQHWQNEVDVFRYCNHIFKIVIVISQRSIKKILSWLTSRGIDLLQVTGGGGVWVNPQAIIKEKNKIFGPYDHIGNFVLMSTCLAPWACLVSLLIMHAASVDCQALLYDQSRFSNLPTRLLHPRCWCNSKLYSKHMTENFIFIPKKGVSDYIAYGMKLYTECL